MTAPAASFTVNNCGYFVPECAHLLLAHNAPVKVKNAQGWSPLAEAISYGDRQMSKHLFIHPSLPVNPKLGLIQNRKAELSSWAIFPPALFQLSEGFLLISWTFYICTWSGTSISLIRNCSGLHKQTVNSAQTEGSGNALHEHFLGLEWHWRIQTGLGWVGSSPWPAPCAHRFVHASGASGMWLLGCISRGLWEKIIYILCIIQILFIHLSHGVAKGNYSAATHWWMLIVFGITKC